jgi:hypothetical protein
VGHCTNRYFNKKIWADIALLESPVPDTNQIPIVNLNQTIVSLNGTYKGLSDLKYRFISVHLISHPSEQSSLILSPDLKVIHLDATPSGTKGVSVAMKAFVTNE